MDFLWAAAGGAAIGVGVALVIALIRKHIKDPTIDTAVSLMAPFAAYLPAEELHASGVIAVVTTGLILGHKAPIIQDATSRLNERINWETIQFLLENSVFLLIGLQVRQHPGRRRRVRPVAGDDRRVLRRRAAGGDPGPAAVGLPGRLLPDQAARPQPDQRRTPGRRQRSSPGRACAGWSPWPPRSCCPATVPNSGDPPPRRLRGHRRNAADPGSVPAVAGPAAADQGARRTGGRAGRGDRADARRSRPAAPSWTGSRTPDDDEELIRILRARGETRLNRVWERLGRTDGDDETPSEQYRRLRMAMLGAEREAGACDIRDHGNTDSEVLAEIMDDLDVEESMIDRRAARAESSDGKTLITPTATAGACDDLDAAPTDVTPNSTEGCVDCLREGTRWVHLRLCLTCGNVGCCDSSVRQHATGISTARCTR